MEEFKELRKVLDEIQIDKFEGLKYKDALEISGTIYKKYNLLFSKWVKSIQDGKDFPLEGVELLLTMKREQILSGYERRPNPKMPNPFDTIQGFIIGLNELRFEKAKRDAVPEAPKCYCSLRLKNNRMPDFTHLVKYGRAILYYEDDEHIIKQCKLCGTKWIDATPHDMSSYPHNWTKWDPKGDFLLRETY
ncbi:MAG: hypothetical protein P1U56_22510 [Saprospiraceae bacterium]|nr:hypothetical protein [Saprospiraceae bacterium]